MKIIPTGVSDDGTRHYEISSIPGAPKEIPCLEPRTHSNPSRSASGPQLADTGPVKPGYSISVKTDAGGISIRVTLVRPDGAMIGKVEKLNTPEPLLEMHGIRHGDSVIVRSMDFVHHIDTV
ncbi:hypothetical protein [Pandoraea soli]